MIVIQSYYYHGKDAKSQAVIKTGKTSVKVKDLKRNMGELKVLKLQSVDDTGKVIEGNAGFVECTLTLMSAERAASYKEEVIFEYERWQPAVGWGNSYPGHLLPIDPGKYALYYTNNLFVFFLYLLL